MGLSLQSYLGGLLESFQDRDGEPSGVGMLQEVGEVYLR